MKLKIENEKLYCKPKWSPIWCESPIRIEDISGYYYITFDVIVRANKPLSLLFVFFITLFALKIYIFGLILGIVSVFFDSSFIKQVFKDSKELFIEDLPEVIKEIFREKGKQELFLFEFSIDRQEVYKAYPELEL